LSSSASRAKTVDAKSPARLSVNEQTATAVRDVDPQNDLTYLRIDTKRFEILVAPFWGEVKYGVTGATKDKGYTLFVLQRKPGQNG